VKILGTGMALPETVETAADIARAVGKTTEWVADKVGIRRRHRAAAETSSQLAARSARLALEEAGLEASDLGWILCGSGTADQAIPSNSAMLQAELGRVARGIPCLDTGMTCLGFVAALHVAEQFFRGGMVRPILLACADLPSVGIHPKRIQEYCLFGDGAAAVVVSPDGNPLEAAFRTLGQFADLCELPAGGSRHHPVRGGGGDDFLFRMDGPRLFRVAAARYPSFLDGFLSAHGTARPDIDWLIPHQASQHALESLSDLLGFPPDRRVEIFADHGNQVSASIPTALHIARGDGRIHPGQKVLLGGTSAGVSFGAALLEIA